MKLAIGSFVSVEDLDMDTPVRVLRKKAKLVPLCSALDCTAQAEWKLKANEKVLRYCEQHLPVAVKTLLEHRLALTEASPITNDWLPYKEEVKEFGAPQAEKARHSRDHCMNCDSPPTVDVLWAEGMARAWFCDDCYAKWENLDDVVAKHVVKDGVVPEKWAKKKGRFVTLDGKTIFVGGNKEHESFMRSQRITAVYEDENEYTLLLSAEGEDNA